MSQRRKRFIAMKREEFEEIIRSTRQASALSKAIVTLCVINFLMILSLVALNFFA